MKTIEEFRSFYKSDLTGTLNKLENTRKSAVVYSLILVAISIILIGGGAYMLEEKEHDTAIGFGIAFLVQLIVIGIIIATKRARIKRRYKKDVIGSMVSFISPGFTYSPASGIPKMHFEASRLFRLDPDRYSSEDLVQGKMGETDVRFSEVDAEYKTVDKDKKVKWNPIFKGIFFVARFKRKFIGETYVLQDKSEKLLGKLAGTLQKTNFSRPPLIKMPDAGFERQFVVYSTNEIEARLMLTPEIMNRLDELNRNVGKISLSFIDNQVHMAIRVHRDLFEPPFWTSVKKFRLVERYFGYLTVCLNIIEDLKLENRIWDDLI